MRNLDCKISQKSIYGKDEPVVAEFKLDTKELIKTLVDACYIEELLFEIKNRLLHNAGVTHLNEPNMQRSAEKELQKYLNRIKD